MFERKEVKNPYRVILYIVLIILGLYSLIDTLNKNNEIQSFISNAEPIQAYVTFTTTHPSSSRSAHEENIYVKYTYKNNTYDNIYVGFAPSSQGYKAGKWVQVYVDPNNPTNARIDYKKSIMLGVIITTIGLLLIISEIVRYIKNKQITYTQLRY